MSGIQLEHVFFVFCPCLDATDSVGLERSIAHSETKKMAEEWKGPTQGVYLRRLSPFYNRVHWGRNKKLINNKFIHKKKTKEI